jgi:hypothetical protein
MDDEDRARLLVVPDLIGPGHFGERERERDPILAIEELWGKKHKKRMLFLPVYYDYSFRFFGSSVQFIP